MKSFLLLFSIISAQPLVNDDAVIEPSVINEIDHAISRAAAASAAPLGETHAELPIATNSLTRTQLAIAIVSAQRADGRWMNGTNDVTAVALRILKELSR